MISLGTLGLYASIPIAAMILAAVIALVRAPSAPVRSAIMHLAVGIVFAVVAVELLPAIIHSDALVAVVIGFSVGVGLMLVLRELLEESESVGGEAVAPQVRSAVGFIAAIGVDLFIDGLMLGVGFAAGEKAGVLLAIALTLETVSLGLAISTSLRERSWSRGRTLRIVGLLSLLMVAGTFIGGLGARYAPAAVLPGVLAFGAAALLFLVTEELLEEAHEVKETPLLTTMFFVGFLALMVLEMANASS